MKRSFLFLSLVALVIASPAAQSLPTVTAAGILAATKVLASDEFEGRAPGTKGEELTVKWLTEQFTTMGLKPGNPDGTYVQKVPMVGITAAETQPLTLAGAAGTTSLKWRDEAVAWTKHVADTAAIKDSELVFAGYGVDAPEFKWDDFKGVDVKGKTIVVFVNDPPIPDPANSSKLDPKTFGGEAMTYGK